MGIRAVTSAMVRAGVQRSQPWSYGAYAVVGVLAIHKGWAVVHLSGAARVVHKPASRHNLVMPWDLRLAA